VIGGSKIAAFVAVAVVATAAGMLLHNWQARAKPDIGPLMALSLPDLQGSPRSLKDWQGKVVVVNFWATWCPPCLKEIPEFVHMQDAHGAKGLQFVGIAADDPAKVREFVAKTPINYPILLAGMDVIEVARKAGNSVGGLPFTVILDRSGNWVLSHSGALDQEKLLPLVRPLL